MYMNIHIYTYIYIYIYINTHASFYAHTYLQPPRVLRKKVFIFVRDDPVRLDIGLVAQPQAIRITQDVK